MKIIRNKVRNCSYIHIIFRSYIIIFNKLMNEFIIPFEKLSYSNKTHILEQTAKEMITCLETNISTHFIKHLFRYINCLFKDPK